MIDDMQSANKGVNRRGFLRKSGAAALGAGAFSAVIQGQSSISHTLTSSFTQSKNSETDKKLRIGVVGGGFGAFFPWSEHPNCQVTAVSDLREERRQKLVEKFHCSNAYAEFHPMLKDPEVDAVAIFTGAPDHVSHCVDVMNAGKHVICAVPAATTLDDCHRLIETVKRTGQIYMMAETSFFHSPTMPAREWKKQGKFGKIYHTEGYYLHDHGSALLTGNFPESLKSMFIYDGKPTWRVGFPQGLYLTHASGPIISVTGEKLVEVSAVGTHIDHPFYQKNRYNNPFINTTFFFKTSEANSSTISIHWWTAASGREGADYYGTQISFFEPRAGQGAYVTFPDAKLKPYQVGGEGAKQQSLEEIKHEEKLPPSMRPLVTEGHGGAEVYIVNEFIMACLERRKPAVDVYQAVSYTAPGICGFESALKSGVWIKVPDFGPPP